MLLRIKFVITLAFFIVLAGVCVPKAYAYVPDLEGYVKTRAGSPIKDVWVRWSENHGQSWAVGVRYLLYT